MKRLLQRRPVRQRKALRLNQAHTSDSSHKWRRSVERPSLRSMAAVASSRRRRNSPWRDAGLGIKMGAENCGDGGRVGTSPPTGSSRRGKFGQSGSRSAQMTRDIEPVPRPRSRAPEGFPCRNLPDEQDIRHGERGFGQVPSGEWSLVRSRERKNPSRNRCTHAFPRPLAKVSSRGRPSDRNAAPGRAPMAARSLSPRASVRCPTALGSMPIQPEVVAGNGQIGGNGQLFAFPNAAGRSRPRCPGVCARSRAPCRRAAANLAEQVKFAAGAPRRIRLPRIPREFRASLENRTACPSSPPIPKVGSFGQFYAKESKPLIPRGANDNLWEWIFFPISLTPRVAFVSLSKRSKPERHRARVCGRIFVCCHFSMVD